MSLAEHEGNNERLSVRVANGRSLIRIILCVEKYFGHGKRTAYILYLVSVGELDGAPDHSNRREQMRRVRHLLRRLPRGRAADDRRQGAAGQRNHVRRAGGMRGRVS